ncbi:MAG: hypothetical protein M3N43_07365 [Actinomycetota bacterium]|nr:hypothetical protein [Actinomycetota bacterium]
MVEPSVGPSATPIPVPNTEMSSEMLYIHISGKLEDFKSHMGDLRTADQLALQAALAAAEKAVDKALASAEKSSDKYEADVERWRLANNEWRAAMIDRESRFVTEDAFDARLNGINTRFDQTDKKLDDLTRSRDLNQGRQMAVTAFIGLAFAAITVALRFVG